MTKTQDIFPVGGLCNRLRFLLTYHLALTGEKLQVYWPETIFCPSLFLDYFKPLPKTTILDKWPNPKAVKKGDIIRGSFFHPKFKLNVIKIRRINIYRYLKPRDFMLTEIKRRIQQSKGKKGSFIAIHVRRTDLARTTKNKEFFNFIDKYPLDQIFLATDNQNTQQIFKQRYGKRLAKLTTISASDKLRKTSIKEAIIDLYVCVSAKAFMGTRKSSFTETIHLMRRAQMNRKMKLS